MCCRDYSANYLYPTVRLAANEGGGGGKASLKHKATSPENKGPILCEETDLSTIQHGLIRHVVLLLDTCYQRWRVFRSKYSQAWKHSDHLLKVLILY